MKKRLLALLLVGCMSASLLACGAKNEEQTTSSSTTQSTTAGTTAATTEAATAATTEPEETNPFKGKEITIFKSDPETVHSNLQGWDYTQGEQLTIDEWLLENEVTAKYLVASSDLSGMMAAVNSKNGPDLMSTNTNFPNIANIGLVQPIDEYYDELAEICGTEYLDLMTYQGHCYGVCMPLAGTRLFQYNKTLFENMGVKTPREYFEEGNWTWETLMKCAEEITRDTDGDGVNDIVGMGGLYLSERLMPSCTIDETGRISSTLNSNKARVLFQMLYEEITLNGTIYRTNNSGAPTMVAEDNVYIAMNYAKNDIWDPAGLYAVTADGDIIESVPQPMYEANDPDYKIERNYFQFAVPNGAQNLEASVSIMDYLLEAGCAMEMMPSGLTNYEFTGLRGTTEDSKAYIEKRQKAYEEAKAIVEALPEYDTEYIAKLLEYIDSYPAYSEQVYSGVTRKFTSQGAEKWATLYTDPASTSIAAAYPVHQAECDTYNSKYIFE